MKLKNNNTRQDKREGNKVELMPRARKNENTMKAALEK